MCLAALGLCLMVALWVTSYFTLLKSCLILNLTSSHWLSLCPHLSLLTQLCPVLCDASVYLKPQSSLCSLLCCLCSLPACLPAFLWDFLDRSLVVLIPFVVRFGYVWSPLGPYFVLGFASAPPMSLCLHVLCSAVWFLIHLMIHTVHETDILAFIYAFPPEKCQHIFCEKGLWLTCSAVN